MHSIALVIVLISNCLQIVLACNRETAEVVTPPKEYIFEYLYKDVDCWDTNKIDCLFGGICQIFVKWSVRQSKVVQNMADPRCSCPVGHSGYRCEHIEFFPSTFSLNAASLLSFVFFLFLILILLIIFIYLCSLKYCCNKKRKHHSSKSSGNGLLAGRRHSDYLKYLCNGVCGITSMDHVDHPVHSTPQLALINTPAKDSMRNPNWGHKAFDRLSIDMYIDDDFDIGIEDPAGDATNFHSALISNNISGIKTVSR